MKTNIQIKKLYSYLLIFWLLLSASAASQPLAQSGTATSAELQSVRSYIKRSWRTLMRSNARLADAAVDPKFPRASTSRWPIYVSRKENIKQIEQTLKSQMSAADFAKLEIRQLPDDPGEIADQGLLYLPYPYVVPGGRFNEMY